MPPPNSAELSEIVLLMTVSVLKKELTMPPPPAPPLLPEIVLLMTVSV